MQDITIWPPRLSTDLSHEDDRQDHRPDQPGGKRSTGHCGWPLPVIMIKVRDGAHVANKAAHIVSVDMDGTKLTSWASGAGQVLGPGVRQLANRGIRTC